MARYQPEAWVRKRLFIGVDIHRRKWHVTVRTEDGVELFSDVVPGNWESFERVVGKYSGASAATVAYEAGFSGFWFYDALVGNGFDAVVTPPNKIPRANGDRVKTDRIDSAQLAKLLQAGLLKSVWVPSPDRRAHREVVRRRWQFKRDSVRAKNQIKAVLRCAGVELSHECTGTWSRAYVNELRSLEFPSPYFKKSFDALLGKLDAITELLKAERQQLRELASSELYRHRVDLLKTIPGIGWLTAIEILLELPEMERFRRADQLAAYVGLTPSQFSSGDHVRMGYITRQGKGNVRAMLVESSWTLIRKDPAMHAKYEQIKKRAGSKRATVAIARKLLLRIRTMLLNNNSYILDRP